MNNKVSEIYNFSYVGLANDIIAKNDFKNIGDCDRRIHAKLDSLSLEAGFFGKENLLGLCEESENLSYEVGRIFSSEMKALSEKEKGAYTFFREWEKTIKKVGPSNYFNSQIDCLNEQYIKTDSFWRNKCRGVSADVDRDFLDLSVDIVGINYMIRVAWMNSMKPSWEN